MRRLSSNLNIESVNGKEMVLCRCGAVLGAADAQQDAKSLLKRRDADLSAAGPRSKSIRPWRRAFFLARILLPGLLPID